MTTALMALWTLLWTSLSRAALAIIAKLLTQKFFEKLLEQLIVSGVQKLADKTDSPLLDQVAAIVNEQLKEEKKP